ncbi:MAG: DUF3560 domain-containing protein [Acidithiobacillus ferriphilus]|jgi:antirestriction protein ArdC|uniref:DUF3560 domain-containing protein n=1 Tax=Acidithiobacillus ferriphilus TaxID=1689834 RepID=UPI00242E0B4F|nr:DUF3560 domain-containing protein [Acidithiobacillus ferriphilus]MBW9250212.1 DUF3560 domain-containing protein [Acidithiobacillus ferriphilus]MBW9255077.1 DUF3560 domain-containing protein [Acidithiobacillus ferriphilus]
MTRAKPEKERRDLRMEVANRLLEHIEQGTAPWQKPWEAGQILPPINVVTGKPYRGVNYQNLMTLCPDPSDPRWCTYKQAREQGWQVREGSSGIPIEVWKEYEHKRTPEEIETIHQESGKSIQDIEKTEKRLGVRYYSVFHASQIDGIPPLARPERSHGLEGRPDPRLDGLSEAMGIAVRRGGNKAFYRPGEDFVQMPRIEDFHTATGHDTTLLHELSHATGHPHRLNREFGKAFGDQKYAIEELRAEMSAAMTAAALGIGFDPAAQSVEEGREMGNSAAYLASWLKALPEKERKQVLMGAIKDAQGICDYLIERTPELQVEVAQERAGPTVFRGDYVRYKNEIGQELEGVVLDDAQPGEATRLRHITRWPNGTPLMEAADHIMPVVLPEVLDVHLVSAVRDGVALNGVDSRTNEYKLTMGSDMERRKMENRVLMDVERARGIYPTFTKEGLQVGDLVRFEPHEPGVTSMSFSGRVIAALDTNTGDVRYHLRAETGPENGAEARVYGRDGQFREIALEQAVGFDRALAPEAEKAPRIQVGDFVVTRSNQFGADWNTSSIVTRIDDSEVRLQDLYRSGQEWEVSPAGRKMTREDFDAALRHQISDVVPPGIASEKLDSASRRDSAASRDRFVGAVRAFDAEHSLLYGKAPEPLTKVPDDVRPFLGVRQASVTDNLLRSSEEKRFFSDKMQELREIIRQMPATYENDGMPDSERPVSLRYFGPNGAQWFILEKDRGDPENEGHGPMEPGFPDQTQAFGLADLGMGHPELGYINIPEITQAGAELDYHFTPATLLEIKRERYPDLLPLDQRPEDLRKEQALQEYQAFYAQLPEREEKLVTEVSERSGRLAPADFRGFSDMMRDFSKGVDDTFGIIREGENRGTSAPELRLAQALATEDISGLPAVKTAREQARRLGERFHDLDKEVRASFKARLKEHGKALLESGTLHEPREIVQATYWKHGIEANPDSPMIGKFTDAIRDKDLQTMMGLIGHNSLNPASEEAFSRLTGVPLGKTQRERVVQLREWAGPERVTALEQAQAEQTLAREDARKVRSLSSAWENLQHLRVNMGRDRVLAGPAYVSEKVSDGKDHVVSRKEGAVTAYYLANRETGELAGVRKDRFTAFAKGVLALDPEGDVRKAMERAGLSQHLPPVERQESHDPSRSAEKTPETPKPNSYEEKQKARQERYRVLAKKMQLRAQARLDQAHRMAETIPFGQPILVGHHSEKRDRRFRERIHNTFGSGFALLEKAEYYERRAQGVNTHTISGDDPEALEKLKVRVETLKTAQERMKAANAAIRKHQKDGPEAQQAALEGLGFQPEQAKSLLTPDVMGTVGFASYSLSNNNANIRRLEERIQTLKKAQKLEDRETRYDWGTVRENKEVNRIQFRFDERPDADTREVMKKSGFRWAPSESAWQRQWTGNAVYAARDVIKKLDERLAPDQSRTDAELRTQAPVSSPGTARPAESLEHSLEALKQHEITLPSKDGGSRTFNARQYLEDGLRRGFTVIEDPDGAFRWQGADGSRGRAFTDEKLTATFRAATAVDKDIGRAIRSAERQKADLEWER